VTASVADNQLSVNEDPTAIIRSRFKIIDFVITHWNLENALPVPGLTITHAYAEIVCELLLVWVSVDINILRRGSDEPPESFKAAVDFRNVAKVSLAA